MPELPEVETVVRGLRPLLEGRRILDVRHASTIMARSAHGRFDELLPRRTILRLDRHGKWMFFRLSDGQTLVIHLGMTGRLAVTPSDQAAVPHTHLRLSLEGDPIEELRFVDPRRFGEILVCDGTAMEERFGAHRLGPEALRVNVRQWRKVLDSSKRVLKAVLLDQRAIAGIGNIYADEILFDCGIYPGRRALSLKDEERARLARSVRRVLRRAIEGHGTTIRDYVTAHGVPGEFQNRLNVYGRANQPCKRCKERIELHRGIVTGRATYFCPRCQPEPANARPPVLSARSAR